MTWLSRSDGEDMTLLKLLLALCIVVTASPGQCSDQLNWFFIYLCVKVEHYIVPIK